MTTAEDTCRVGDPDPTPDDTKTWILWCPAEIPGYFCTRDYGHTGQHVAGDGEEVLAVWPAADGAGR